MHRLRPPPFGNRAALLCDRFITDFYCVLQTYFSSLDVMRRVHASTTSMRGIISGSRTAGRGQDTKRNPPEDERHASDMVAV